MVHFIRQFFRSGLAAVLATGLVSPPIPSLPMTAPHTGSPYAVLAEIPITIGETVHGALEVGAPPLPNRTLADEYSVGLAANQTVSLMIWPDAERAPDAGAFPLGISLWYKGRLVVADDAAAGSGEREIVFTPTHSGTYLLRVSLLLEVPSQPRAVYYILQTSLRGDHPQCSFARVVSLANPPPISATSTVTLRYVRCPGGET